jgi:hypothetical protein
VFHTLTGLCWSTSRNCRSLPYRCFDMWHCPQTEIRAWGRGSHKLRAGGWVLNGTSSRRLVTFLELTNDVWRPFPDTDQMLILTLPKILGQELCVTRNNGSQTFLHSCVPCCVALRPQVDATFCSCNCCRNILISEANFAEQLSATDQTHLSSTVVVAVFLQIRQSSLT